MSTFPESKRTKVPFPCSRFVLPRFYEAVMQMRRAGKSGVYDKATVHAILDEALACTVTYAADDGTPVTIPTNFVRDDEDVCFHGKSNAEFIRKLAGGAQVCVNFTIVRILHVVVPGRTPWLTLDAHSCSLMSLYLHDQPSITLQTIAL